MVATPFCSIAQSLLNLLDGKLGPDVEHGRNDNGEDEESGGAPLVAFVHFHDYSSLPYVLVEGLFVDVPDEYSRATFSLVEYKHVFFVGPHSFINTRNVPKGEMYVFTLHLSDLVRIHTHQHDVSGFSTTGRWIVYFHIFCLPSKKA